MPSEEIKKEAIEMFKKQYPNAKLDKFKFGYNLYHDGKLKSIDIYYKITPNYSDWVLIADPRFKNNSKYKEDLYGLSNVQINSTADSKAVVHESNVHTPGFPALRLSNGTIQKVPESKPYTDVDDNLIPQKFPDRYILNYPIENFRIHVNSNTFLSKLPPILRVSEKSYLKGLWDDNEIYYKLIFCIYCATYCCGISIQHLTPSVDVHPIITSLMRFHVYFTVRRILRRLNGGEPMFHISKEFNAGEIYQNNDHIRNWICYPNAENKIQQYVHIYKVKYGFGFYKHNYQDKTSKFFLKDRGPKMYALFPYTMKDDYRRYVPVKSNGFTKIGIQYLNESIEAFLYSILVAQARIKQSIVSNRASALKTQQEFRKIVEDSKIYYDVTTWISKMNRAITQTNIILNLAISPNLWLLSNNLIILKDPIAGYNNSLKTARENVFWL